MIEAVLGIAIGIIMAFTGTGGGILVVPLLVLGAQLSFPEAAPVKRLTLGIGAAMGAILVLMPASFAARLQWSCLPQEYCSSCSESTGPNQAVQSTV